LSKKRNIYAEGSLADLYRMFLKPLRAHKPENLSGPYWDDVILATEGREIRQFDVLETFTIPGNLLNAPRIIGSGLPEYRSAVAGSRIFIRSDDDFLDIENPVDADLYERVFRTDLSSLRAILDKVRVVRDE
jgi:hypothetical protein